MKRCCEEIADKLLRFRDGELGAADTEYLRHHLHCCPGCMGLLRSYEEVIEVLKRLRPVQMPEGLLDRLKHRIRLLPPVDEGACPPDCLPAD